MSYFDPHGVSEPRGWGRPGDQWDADRVDHRGAADRQAGSRYDDAEGYGPPSGYEPPPGYGPTSGYEPSFSQEPSPPVDPRPPFDPPGSFDPPAPLRTSGPYDAPPGYGGSADPGWSPETFRPRPSDPPGYGPPDMTGPAAYRRSAAPVDTAPPGWDTPSAADPRGPDRYPPDRPPADLPYGSAPHRADPHQPGGTSEPYPLAPPPAVHPYPTGGDTAPAPADPTDPVGWASIDADTQTLPRVGAETTGPAGRAAGSAPGAGDAGDAGEAPAAASTPRSSRAGRNLPAAIGVGLALGALIVVPLFVYPPAFLVVIVAAASVGTWEFTRAVRQGSGVNPPLPPLLGGGLLMVGLAWWAGPDALSLALLVTILATLIWRLGDGPRGFQRDLTAATLIAVYVPFLGGFAALLTAVPGDGHLRVLVTLVAVVLSDTGGYAAGVTFGRHPMAPSVSPKKSWEGFAGSVLAAAVGSAILLWALLDVHPLWGAIFGMAVSVAAVVGDLGESMVKRDIGVKDMSNLLPGHGGLMDRLDSVLFAMPVAYLLLALFAPSGSSG